MKVCTKCNLTKDSIYFSKLGKYLCSWCKECKAKHEKQKRILKGIITKPVPKTTKETKECLKCLKVLTLDKFSKSRRGRLGLSSYCRPCVNKYFKPSREKSRLYTQKYRDNNRLHWRALHRINQFKRRFAIEVNSDGTVTKSFLELLFLNDICFYCNKVCSQKEKTIEHIIPLSKGGTHTSSNIAMSCLSCNCSKGGKTKEDFLNDRI